MFSLCFVYVNGRNGLFKQNTRVIGLLSELESDLNIKKNYGLDLRRSRRSSSFLSEIEICW